VGRGKRERIGAAWQSICRHAQIRVLCGRTSPGPTQGRPWGGVGLGFVRGLTGFREVAESKGGSPCGVRDARDGGHREEGVVGAVGGMGEGVGAWSRRRARRRESAARWGAGIRREWESADPLARTSPEERDRHALGNSGAGIRGGSSRGWGPVSGHLVRGAGVERPVGCKGRVGVGRARVTSRAGACTQMRGGRYPGRPRLVALMRTPGIQPAFRRGPIGEDHGIRSGSADDLTASSWATGGGQAPKDTRGRFLVPPRGGRDHRGVETSVRAGRRYLFSSSATTRGEGKEHAPPPPEQARQTHEACGGGAGNTQGSENEGHGR